MTTSIIFKIDPKLKKAAQKRAAEKGIALSQLYQHATRSFVDGKLDIALQNEPLVPNKKTAAFLRRIDRIPKEKLIKMSIALNTPEEINTFFKSLSKKK